MVLGQLFCRFTGSAAQTHSARRPQLVSKIFLEEQIFASWPSIAKIAKISASRKISRDYVSFLTPVSLGTRQVS